MDLDTWFLTVEERGNTWTEIDRRRGGVVAWTEGNAVTPLADGTAYFGRLYDALCRLRDDDWVHLTDWEGDPDQRLTDRPETLADVLCDLARRDVHVRGLVWRSIRVRPTSRSRSTFASCGRSTRPAVRSSSTNGSGAAEVITRSWSSSATRPAPPTTSPSSAASTSRTGGATITGTSATLSPSSSTRATANARRGTTCSSRSADRRWVTWPTRSGSAGTTRPRSTTGTRGARACGPSPASPAIPTRCHPSA